MMVQCHILLVNRIEPLVGATHGRSLWPSSLVKSRQVGSTMVVDCGGLLVVIVVDYLISNGQQRHGGLCFQNWWLICIRIFMVKNGSEWLIGWSTMMTCRNIFRGLSHDYAVNKLHNGGDQPKWYWLVSRLIVVFHWYSPSTIATGSTWASTTDWIATVNNIED